MFVLSTKPHAKVLSLDKSQASCMPGVRLILTAEDIADVNDVKGVGNPIFADGKVLI